MELSKVILSILLVFSNQAFAQNYVSQDPANCSKVLPVKKGDPAPCDGFYFPDQIEKEAAANRADADYYRRLSTKLQQKSDLEEKQNDILSKRLQLYIEQSEALARKDAERSNTETLYRFAYFVTGVVVTGVIAANVRR